MGYETRTVEKKIAELFSECKPFSEHLVKWEDKDLPDKYDHNCFEYCGQPTEEEFVKAIQYQKGIGAGFIKLEGDAPLSDSFGLEESITLTMIQRGNNTNWKTNPDLEFHTPPIKELEELEVKHFGPLYGEDFTRRNIRRLYKKLTYYGAYLNDILVGACYCFCDDGLTCIDGLIVDEKYRKMHIATSLIAKIRRDYPETTLFLHADEEDTPKKIYEKLGFETVDKLFEYTCLDI